MNYRNDYIRRVNRICSREGDLVEDLSFWRNNLFAGAIIYLLPFCLIALLPGIYFSFATGHNVLGAADILAILGMAVVAFVPGISLLRRKIIFIFFMYAISIVLLYYLGLYGPGLLYLMAACIFSVLIFQTRYRFWPAWLNTFICLSVAVAISFDLLPWMGFNGFPVMEWLVVSSNLIFLSFLFSALIPRLFNGLQNTMEKEKHLQSELSQKQFALQHAWEKLQQKNVDLEQFAYVASHDLKEPLRMVTSFMGLLKNRYGAQLDAKAHTYIEFAVDGGKRMQKMIADLLELSRSGRQAGEKELVDLNSVLAEVRQNIFRLIEDNEAEIILNAELPHVCVDKMDIVRLLQNLLSNAIKFRKADVRPLVWISSREEDVSWSFQVADNGIGIEAGKHQKIFEVFTRLHSQASYEGTGIGLAICKKIVERNGGEISVSSVEGEGSVFCFTILK